MRKKGQVTIYVSYLLTAFIILAITAVVAPTGALFTTEAIAAGDTILAQANESLNNIQNQTIKDEIGNIITSAREAGTMNIQVTTDLFKYSWVIMLVLVGIVGFLFTRQIVEFRPPGGFV